MSKGRYPASWDGFQLSRTFGTAHETDKDRAKREIMEFMPPLKSDAEVIVVDPDVYYSCTTNAEGAEQSS